LLDSDSIYNLLILPVMSSDGAIEEATAIKVPLDWQTYSITSLYDSIGGKYEIAYQDISAQRVSLEWLLSQLPHTGCNVLDIGCGTGCPVASTLSAAPGHHHVHGIDISERMLSVARLAVPSATFEQIDLRNFQADPATFDAITSYFALLVAMSQEQIRETMRKIWAWLKPGGLLVFSTIPADLEHFEQTWLGRKAVFSSLSEKQYAILMKDLGFIVEYSKVESFMPMAVEAGLCMSDEVMMEPQLFMYARKPQ
jgi:2-polyprenyl-3-methyl-5-hydroxy-6-metoxy-1,4-benzoquinol methylase